MSFLQRAAKTSRLMKSLTVPDSDSGGDDMAPPPLSGLLCGCQQSLFQICVLVSCREDPAVLLDRQSFLADNRRGRLIGALGELLPLVLCFCGLGAFSEGLLDLGDL